jgi:hypothetical protein
MLVENHSGATQSIHFLLPDVCLNSGVFLDGSLLEELQEDFAIEVVPSRGHMLKQVITRFLEKAEAGNV